jgi:WXG100 family type VII secretion target
MAGSFQAGSAELNKASSQMQEANAQLQGNLAKLAQECQQIESSWSGMAATAFQTLMERFQTDAKNLNDSLDQISSAVSSNASNYARQEQEAQQSISKITNALGG